jgi:uncharacterized membrane protein
LTKSSKALKKDRAFELDFLRGIAIVMMMFMHFSYDIRYEFGCDTFEYLRTGWFWSFVHPIIIVLFVGLSGICCTFSRNNLKRGLKLLAVAMAFTVVTSFVTYKMGIYCLILFNVLHMLSISTLVYAFFTFIEKKAKIKKEQMTFVMLLFGTWVAMTANHLDMFDCSTSNMLFYPLGFVIKGEPDVADYMPLIPWLGVFLICAAAGRILYSEKKTLFGGAGKVTRAITRPLEFLGRHSLIIYLVHQPVIYGVLYVIFLIAGKV